MHESNHTGEKSCVCKHCGKVFYSPTHIQRLEQTHSGEKSYEYKQNFLVLPVTSTHMKKFTLERSILHVSNVEKP
jgi:uncharacterized Zn-finger protein